MSEKWNCPVCGEPIEGDLRDDIRIEWSKHMGQEHLMKSREWMEKNLKSNPKFVIGLEVFMCKTLSGKFFEDCTRVVLFDKLTANTNL